MKPVVMSTGISGCASSDTAVYVERSVEQSNLRLQLSNALGLASSGIFQKLNEVVQECSLEGWDGEKAKPISTDTMRNAWNFLISLPLGTESPEVSAEPDGAIVFEWYRAPRKVLSVSIEPDGFVYYAALLGSSRRHGVDFAQGRVSEDLLELISQVVYERFI